MCILYMYVCIHRNQQPLRGQQRQHDQGWREIHAAVALTSLAQGQSCTADQSSAPVSSAATGQSYTRGPLSVAKTTITDGMSNTGSASGLQQSCATGPALTNRIIQKSSHISEVQTVKVSLANSVQALNMLFHTGKPDVHVPCDIYIYVQPLRSLFCNAD